MDGTQLLMLGIFLLVVIAGAAWYIIFSINQLLDPFLQRQEFLLKSLVQKQESTLKALPRIFTETAGEQLSIQVSPVAQEVARLSASLSVGLHDSNQQFRQATKEISAQAAEIKQLRVSLEQSHARFQQAVMTLAEPGSLQEWVQQLALGIEPLERVQATLDEHYKINGHLVQRTDTLLTQWIGQHDTVARSSEKIADSLAQWAGSEIARRAEFERHIRQYLEETGKQSHQMAQKLGALQTEIHELVSSTKASEATTQRSVNALRELIELQKEVAKDQKNVVNSLSEVSAELTDRQTELGRELARLAKRVNSIGEATETWQATLQQEFKTQLAEMADEFQSTINQFHASHQQVLTQLQQQNQFYINTQQQSVQQVTRSIANLPTQQQQMTQNALLVALLITQLILAGVIFYAL